MMCAQTPAQQSSTNPFLEKIRAQESLSILARQADGIAWLRLAILYQDAARYTDAESAYRKAIPC